MNGLGVTSPKQREQMFNNSTHLWLCELEVKKVCFHVLGKV